MRVKILKGVIRVIKRILWIREKKEIEGEEIDIRIPKECIVKSEGKGEEGVDYEKLGRRLKVKIRKLERRIEKLERF